MRQALEVYNYIKVIISSSIPDWVEESPQEEIELGDLHILGAESRCSGDSAHGWSIVHLTWHLTAFKNPFTPNVTLHNDII